MRRALNDLQCVAAGMGTVTHDSVFTLLDIPQPTQVEKLLELCEQGFSIVEHFCHS
jgi:hypothetical protein